MSRGREIAAIVAGSLAGLVLIVILAGIVIVQTACFPQFRADQDLGSG